MSSYKFDGTLLKQSGRTIANVSGDRIREGSGSKVVANVRSNQIRQGSGGSVAFNVRGDNICQSSGSTRIATMKDVNRAIDGPGKVTKAALWLFFCR